jgi:hypothetical protein
MPCLEDRSDNRPGGHADGPFMGPGVNHHLLMGF